MDHLTILMNHFHCMTTNCLDRRENVWSLSLISSDPERSTGYRMLLYRSESCAALSLQSQDDMAATPCLDEAFWNMSIFFLMAWQCMCLREMQGALIQAFISCSTNLTTLVISQLHNFVTSQCQYAHFHNITAIVGISSIHVQLAPSRRETMLISGWRAMGTVRSMEQRPVHRSEVERVQVVKIACPWSRS
jgi:hypothetical protein